ncbi:mitochondrial distribution and morphology protein 12 [Striga asiatica]|uniref:Mitochondrial distribution and morphology protein 12 n=1 Tax=Striga asiatica TaxID=4170 RepID=A0A5A7QQQ1_STRAF|nr:mitochondrial distribution and morphology protein 12 [Striga asiatica]
MVNSGPNIKGTGKKDGSTAELRPSDTIAVEQPKHLLPDRIRRSPPPTTAPPLPSPLAGGKKMVIPKPTNRGKGKRTENAAELRNPPPFTTHRKTEIARWSAKEIPTQS